MLAPRMGEFDPRELARVGNLLAQARFFWLLYHMIFSTNKYINNTHLGKTKNTKLKNRQGFRTVFAKTRLSFHR